MKKLLVFLFAIFLSGSAKANIVTTVSINSHEVSQEKVAVKPEDLPEAVKTTLSGDAYAGWQVVSAFLITKEDNSQFFEVSMKKGEETSTVNLDKDGKKVE